MTALPIAPPFPVFTGVDGKPIDGGQIFVGTAGMDPVTNPIPIFWDSEFTQPAAQPVIVNGGYPVRAGTPSRLFANADSASITVKDAWGVTVFTASTPTPVADEVLVDTGIVSVFEYLTASEIADVTTRAAVLDVTANVQAALTDAANNGGTLVFPAGKYRVSGLTIPSGSAGRVFIRMDARADIVPTGDNLTLLSIPTDATRAGPRVIEGGRFDGEDRTGVHGIALGGTTTALLYTRLNNVYVTRCDEAFSTRNVQEAIFDGIIAFDNRVGFVAESSPTTGGSTVMQWTGCRFQNNQVNFFGLSSSVFPIGGWTLTNCTFQTGFHSGVVLYGQTGGMNRLDNISMVGCHFEANQQGADANITVRGKTFGKASLRLVGADLSCSNGCELSMQGPSRFAVLQEASNLVIEDSRVPSGQALQFESDSTSKVYLEGRVVMTGSGTGITSWRGFDWKGNIGGALVGVPTLVGSTNVPNEYAAPGLFPNAPFATNQIGATPTYVFDQTQGEVRQIAFLASAGSTSNNRVIVDALPMAFSTGDFGLVTLLVSSSDVSNVRFLLQGGSGALGNVSAVVRPGLQRVVLYGKASAAEASGFDLFIFPDDAVGATIKISKMMSIHRTVAEGVEDIVNVIRYGWYDDLLSAVYGTGIPASGTWPKGKVILNRDGDIGEPRGWQKVTQGSTNVLGTDWVALANL